MTGGRRRPVSRPSRRRCFLASSRVEPLTERTSLLPGRLCRSWGRGRRSARARAPRCPAGRPSWLRRGRLRPNPGGACVAAGGHCCPRPRRRRRPARWHRHRRRRRCPPEPLPRALPPGSPHLRRPRRSWRSCGFGCARTAVCLPPGRHGWPRPPQAPGPARRPGPRPCRRRPLPPYPARRSGRGHGPTGAGGAAPRRRCRHRHRRLRRARRAPKTPAGWRFRSARAQGVRSAPAQGEKRDPASPAAAGTSPAAAGTPPRAPPGSAHRHHVRPSYCHLILCRAARSRASGQSPVRLPGARYRGVPLAGGVPRRARTPHGSTLST